MNQKTELLFFHQCVCLQPPNGKEPWKNPSLGSGVTSPRQRKNAQREEKGVATLPGGFTTQQTKRCDEMLGCTHANINQWYFLEQALNAGAESSTAQHCTTDGLESSLFLFSQLNAIFEIFYPLYSLISAINYMGHVMN